MEGGTTQEIVRYIEELSLNAWPAVHTLTYDGWLLRFSAGYTKRANSVNPLYPSTEPLEQKIARCEALYSERHGLDVVFKLTTAAEPVGLDSMLETRGYRRIDETSVQTLSLERLLSVEDRDGSKLMLSSTLTQAWLDAYVQISGVSAQYRPTMEAMLKKIDIAGQAGFVSLNDGEGHTRAVGLGVLERGHLGLFDITVAEPLRGRGLGTLLMKHLLHWGSDNGAHTAYLQVVKTNTAALRLYARLGFVERYTYWYRVALK